MAYARLVLNTPGTDETRGNSKECKQQNCVVKDRAARQKRRILEIAMLVY